MKVMATLLGNTRVSVTLVDDNSGWRFHHWSMDNNQPVGIEPSPDDVAQRFTTAHDALDYFEGLHHVLSHGPEIVPTDGAIAGI